MRQPAAMFWLFVFGVNCAFQAWRGSVHDLVFFLGVTAVIALEASGAFANISLPKLRTSRLTIAGLALGLATALGLSDLFSVGNQVLLWTLLPVLVWSLWPDRPKVQLTKNLRTTVFAWTSLGLVLGVWELANYVLAQGPGGDASFPTVSVLLDPLLAANPGRAIVSALWVLAGVGLIRGRATK